jgi:hypothetical protein
MWDKLLEKLERKERKRLLTKQKENHIKTSPIHTKYAVFTSIIDNNKKKLLG